ncbi:PREDICTED: lysine-specific demethylase 7A [Elephantulus edwardii]|uniref:lysine-specific demethylase 7A n=1 Tax=Elephantulus edwardii TaxID=28737 RepID=UPI0003F0812F|nr:PREDICTED: lysine-specific demethylase 7A [Elephantulus edwardii]
MPKKRRTWPVGSAGTAPPGEHVLGTCYLEEPALHCVGVEEHHAFDIDLYHCPNCALLHGASLMKTRRNWHRHDCTEADDGSKPVQAGTRAFVKELRARVFPSADDVIVKMHGGQLTHRYLEKHGFDVPIMVPKLDDLGLRLPPPTFSVVDVERYVGGDKVIDVIDVARQADSKMTLHNYVKYFTNPNRPKVLNVISLEFSDTKMSELVEVPDIARKLSWVENYWPDDSVFPKPFVQKYCLMGVEDSYTDFHIDFGGTSVWYHVLWGEKIFYLIKPTDENLALYESWSSSVTQSEVFFGEKVDSCYKCVVKQGHTLFVPTGWIHAVLTSQDCMAFGGNFLHNLNIGMQLRCYEMEKRLKTPDLFKFPFFEAICWFVAKNLLETLKELREDGFQPQTYLVRGVKALHTALKLWMKKELVSEHAFEIPDNVRPGHLIKELSKVIRAIEEEHSRPVKSQGIPTVCPLSRPSNEAASPYHSRRKMRRLRDHTVRTPSNLDILELHTREVLRRLEMCPWEEVVLSPKLNGKFNKHLQPSSTVPDGRAKDNDLRLLLTNGRIVKDERQPFSDSSLYTADSESEEDRRRTRKMKVKLEEPSGLPGVEREESQTSLNRFLTGVKSELRNGPSEYSDISDSEDSGPDCTALKNHFTTEESESSGDEKKQEITSNFKEKSNTMKSFLQKTQELSRSEIPVKRECPTSTSTEEEAIQGMLSMAGLRYSPCPQRPLGTVDGGSPDPKAIRDAGSCPSSDHEARPLCRPDRPTAGGFHIKTSDHDLRASSWIKQFDTTSRLNPQDLNRGHRVLKKEGPSELPQKGQSRSHVDSSGLGLPTGKCMQSAGVAPGPCQVSSGSLSPEQPAGDSSFSLPLHPTKRPASNPPPISNQATKGKRPKKGMATAKQRLGKILKLNRNGHARFFV